jgi:hypothetical protein
MNHTPGAIRAAEIITGGKYLNKDVIYDTAYGPKTVERIADIIDCETATPEMLKIFHDLLADALAEYQQKYCDFRGGAKVRYSEEIAFYEKATGKKWDELKEEPE